MKQGNAVDCFSVKGKDGKKIKAIFRFPSKKDVRDLLKMVNSIRTEADYLGMHRMETLKSERKWLFDRLKEMEKRTAITLLVEINGELAGNSSIWPVRRDACKHIGEFGIMLKEKFTGHGIGTRLGKKMLQLAKKETGYKIIESGHLSPNKRSAKLHKKLGFKQYGRLPKGCKLKTGKYCDHILLYKVIG